MGNTRKHEIKYEKAVENIRKRKKSKPGRCVNRQQEAFFDGSYRSITREGIKRKTTQRKRATVEIWIGEARGKVDGCILTHGA